MTDRPILFSGPMVRALLDGRKTQTRRLLKLPTKGIYVNPKMGGWAPSTVGGGASFTIARDGSRQPAPEKVCIWHQTTGTTIVTRWQKGDRLWCRESIGRRGASFLGVKATNGVEEAFYVADDSDVVNADGFNICPWWKSKGAIPGIHMPRWASRLTLAVTDVRVQRLQEISEADCIAEGLLIAEGDGGGPGAGYKWKGKGYHGAGFDAYGGPTFHVPALSGRCSCKVADSSSPRCAYREIWNAINGAGSWDANPWIVALTFTVERRNIDAIEKAAA